MAPTSPAPAPSISAPQHPSLPSPTGSEQATSSEDRVAQVLRPATSSLHTVFAICAGERGPLWPSGLEPKQSEPASAQCETFPASRPATCSVDRHLVLPVVCDRSEWWFPSSDVKSQISRFGLLQYRRPRTPLVECPGKSHICPLLLSIWSRYILFALVTLITFSI
jgi:hypothetical protein